MTGKVSVTRSRKMGVAIENVMLGLIIILVFAGGLYYAFSQVSYYMERKRTEEHIRSYMSLVREYTAVAGYGDIDKSDQLTQYMANSGLSYGAQEGVQIIPGYSFGDESRVGYGGYVIMAQYGGMAGSFNRLALIVSWNTSIPGTNVSKGRQLCHSLAGRDRTDYDLDLARFQDGPLGNDYLVITASCDRATATFTVLYNMR